MKKLYLHIGNFKTGSTSLQTFIFQNRKIFEKNKISTIYEKNFFRSTINNMQLFKHFNEMKQNQALKYLKKNKKMKNLIISSEYFSCISNSYEKLRFLKKTIKKAGYKPVVIFYYRKDAFYLFSFYAQQLTQRKRIYIENVFEFVSKLKRYGYYFNKKNKYYFLSQNYYFNNRKIYKNWQKVFKQDFYSITFNKDRGNQLFYDFIKVIGLDKNNKFKMPAMQNVTRRTKPWNIIRIFYLVYLFFAQKIIFKNDDLVL